MVPKKVSARKTTFPRSEISYETEEEEMEFRKKRTESKKLKRYFPQSLKNPHDQKVTKKYPQDSENMFLYRKPLKNYEKIHFGKSHSAEKLKVTTYAGKVTIYTGKVPKNI